MGENKTQPLRLIAITDRNVLGMGDPVRAAEEALAGGLPTLMLREKDLPNDQLLPIANRLRRATARAGALLLLNRNLEVARGVGADGVHLGVDGPTIAEARRALGSDARIGYSAHDINEALRAFEDGADYVIFSPIFETPSKTGILRPVGLEALGRLAAEAPGPVVALGGIDATQLPSVLASGASGVAVIRAIFGTASPREATRALLELIPGPDADSTAALSK